MTHHHGLTADQVEEYLTLATNLDLDDTPEPLRAETRRLAYLTLAVGTVTGSTLTGDVVLLTHRYEALLDVVARQEFLGDPDLVRVRVEGAAVRRSIPVLEQILANAVVRHTLDDELDEAGDAIPPASVIRDLLLLVHHDRAVTLEEIEGWDEETRLAVVEWASAVHLYASDHDDVVIPPRPRVLLPEETLRNPYVGEGADGARRSAAIDLSEIEGLDRDDPRVPELRASREAWLRQADLLEEGIPVPPGSTVWHNGRSVPLTADQVEESDR